MTDAAQQTKPAWPAMSIAQAHALLTAAGHALRDGGARHRGRAHPHLEERAADAAQRARSRPRPRREDLPRLRGRARQLRRLLPRRLGVRARAARQGGREGRPRRHRHAQPAGMAGRLLRRPGAGRDRDAAERLVDRAGAGVRADRLRDQGRHRRRRAARAPQGAPAQLPGPEGHLRQPRGGGGGRPEGGQARERHRRDGRLGQPARSSAAGGRGRAGRPRDHLLHLGHDRKAQGRAGHQPQRQLQHPRRRDRRGARRSCAAASARRRPIRTRRR